MKVITTEDGQIALLLTPELLKQIQDAIPKKQKVYSRPPDDLFYNFKSKTVDFLKAVKAAFDGPVARKDPKLIDLMYEHRVTNISQILLELEKRGGASVIIKENGRIDCFELKI